MSKSFVISIVTVSLVFILLMIGLTPRHRPYPVAKCRAEIEHIHNALLEYKLEYDEYPSVSGSDATVLASTAVTNWMPKGVDFVDEWGTPYYLEFMSNNTTYVLFSFGPDKKQGTEDDVGTER